MDNTNKLIKLSRRMKDVEHAMECKDQSERTLENLRDELYELNVEFNNIWNVACDFDLYYIDKDCDDEI